MPLSQQPDPMTSDGPTSVRSDRVGAVRRLANRSFRQKVGRFLAEGPQSVREAVRCQPHSIDEVFVIEDAGPAVQKIVSLAHEVGVRVTSVPEPVLLAMTETVHPQGIAAVCSFLPEPVPAELLASARLVVALHEVRDPGNAGTILRTADAAGADGVIFVGDSVDPYNGKCVRSTAGSLFHVPFTRCADLAELAGLAAGALQVWAASGDAADELSGLGELGLLAQPTLWLFGNEAHGLPPDTPADRRVAIPIFGKAESLNLSAAAAVCLYASAFAQRVADAGSISPRPGGPTTA